MALSFLYILLMALFLFSSSVSPWYLLPFSVSDLVLLILEWFASICQRAPSSMSALNWSSTGWFPSTPMTFSKFDDYSPLANCWLTSSLKSWTGILLTNSNNDSNVYTTWSAAEGLVIIQWLIPTELFINSNKSL